MRLSIKEILLYIIGFVSFIGIGPLVMLFLANWYPFPFLEEQASTFYLGGLTSAVGLFFTLWSNYELIVKGKGGAANFGKIHLMTETKHLVTTGPYSICRNPMHLGVFLYYSGFACAINSLISLVIPCFIVIFAYAFALFLDEPRLKRDFPEEYEAYASQVPRFMPRIFKRS